MSERQRHTFVVYVEDKPGVLNRVASLFRRRAFNIESLTVGHTETKGVSRMTIVVDTDTNGARRLEANLYKLVNVLRVTDLRPMEEAAAAPPSSGGGCAVGVSAQRPVRKRSANIFAPKPRLQGHGFRFANVDVDQDHAEGV